MEDRLWQIVVSAVPLDKGSSRQIYSEGVILLVVLWAILHDRPICWACDPGHWSAERRLAGLPHPSTVSRRSRGPQFAACLEGALQQLRDQLGPVSQEAVIDGKPLVISDYSRDPDAANGRSYRSFGKGYKLHAVIDGQGVVLAHEVAPLNVNERVPAGRLLPRLPRAVRRVVADGNYDSSRLHRALEGRGVRLYAPPLNNYAGPRSHPRRRELVRLSQHPVAHKLERFRDHIERQFGLMGNYGCGLKGLPNWVRRQHRVERWIDAKLVIHHAFLINKRQQS